MSGNLFLSDYETTKKLQPKYGIEHIGMEAFHLQGRGYGPDYELDAAASRDVRALDTRAGLVAKRRTDSVGAMFVSDPWGEERDGAGGLSFEAQALGGTGGVPAGEADAAPKEDFEDLGPAQQMLRIQEMKQQFIDTYGDSLSPKVLSAAINRFDVRQAEIDRTNTISRAAAQEELSDWVRQGNDPNAFPASKGKLISELGWKAADELYLQSVAGTGNVTNPIIHNELMDMVLRVDPKTKRVGIADVNLLEYAPGLSAVDYRKFQELQRTAQAVAFNLEVEKLTPVPMVAEMYPVVQSAAKSVLPAFGGDDKSEGYQNLVYQLERWAEVEAAREGRKGELSAQETRAKAREMVASVVLNPSGLLNQTEVQGFQMDFGERTSSAKDDFTIEKARAAIENEGFTINGVQITEPQLTDAEEQVIRRFGEGIAPARLNELVMGYLFAEYGDVHMGNR